MHDPHSPPPPAAPASARAVSALLPGSRLGGYEIQRVIARSLGTVVYLASDLALALPVAIQEYLPARFVQRDAQQRLRTIDPAHDDVVERGLRAFIGEARLLARCDHPSLVRVSQLFEAHGTAYRVMPYCEGQRLLDLRRNMRVAPDEAALRTLLDGLLGALEAIHRAGHAHGGVTPANILLRSDDRPLLLGPGAAGREVSGDLVAALMADLQPAFAPLGSAAAAPAGVGAGDLRDLAQVLRFCITGATPAPDASDAGEPVSVAIARAFEPAARPHYSDALLSTLDCALAPVAEDRPSSVAQFREWLAHGAPRGSGPAPLPVAAGAIDRATNGAPNGAAPSPRAPARPTPAPAPLAAPASSGAPAALTPPPIPAAPRRGTAPTTLGGHAADAAMTTDRAPWGPNAPSLQRARRASTRWRQALLGGAVAVLGAALVAAVTGAWDLMPAIRVDSLAGAALGLTAAPRPPPPAQAPAPAFASTSTSTSTSTTASASASASSPIPTGARADAPVPASATVSARPGASAPLEATAPAGAASTETAAIAASPAAMSSPARAPAPASALSPTSTSASAPEPVPATLAASPLPAREVRVLPAAAPAPTAPPRPPAPPPTRAAIAADAPAPSAGPRAACAPRTEFALYRCMQTQCRTARWSAHAQCVRLRAADAVD